MLLRRLLFQEGRMVVEVVDLDVLVQEVDYLLYLQLEYRLELRTGSGLPDHT
jgi:hypothetical protein